MCKMFRTQTITPRRDFVFYLERTFTNRPVYMIFCNILHFALSRRVGESKIYEIGFGGQGVPDPSERAKCKCHPQCASISVKGQHSHQHFTILGGRKGDGAFQPNGKSGVVPVKKMMTQNPE